MPIKNTEARRAYQREWLRKRRQDWINSQGGKCVKCDSTDRLEVDHIDRSTKTLYPREIWGRAEHIREAELAKCQVLCHDCHLAKTKAEIPEWKGVLMCGTFSKYNKGCRCSECKSANADRSRNYRALVR